MPRALLDELRRYDDDVAWVLRRGARFMLDDEAEARRLAVGRKRGSK